MISIQTPKCGFIHVYVQGNLEDRNGKTIIMTVHDVGTNCRLLYYFMCSICIVVVKPFFFLAELHFLMCVRGKGGGNW